MRSVRRGGSRLLAGGRPGDENEQPYYHGKEPPQ